MNVRACAVETAERLNLPHLSIEEAADIIEKHMQGILQDAVDVNKKDIVWNLLPNTNAQAFCTCYNSYWKGAFCTCYSSYWKGVCDCGGKG